MRVFVTGTGRMGSLTFAKACEHVHGFTAAHESLRGEQLLDPVYPDNHIEIGPHLVWIIPDLLYRYPRAKWFVLTRDRAAVVRSIAQRPSLPGWSRLAFNRTEVPSPDAAARFVDFVEGALHGMLPEATWLRTPVDQVDWEDFLFDLRATADPVALQVLQTVHNAGGAA